jgi:hypothetical protein
MKSRSPSGLVPPAGILPRSVLSLLAVGALILSPVVGQAVAPPMYQVTSLGNGSPSGINALGTVIGSRLVNGSDYQPLVSRQGQPWQILPVPAETRHAFPTDLNDHDVLVGVCYDAQWNARAVRWVPEADGYRVEILPRLPGDTNSYATAINNAGEIVGARRALGFVPAATTGWLLSDSLGVVDLFAAYGLATVPTDLNDGGKILSGGGVLDLNTGKLTEVGATGPSNYQAISGVVINSAGEILGSAPLRSTSLNIVSVFKFVPGTGWITIGGSSRYARPVDLNELGDVGWGELGAGVYFSGLGNFALGDLLAPAAVAEGWSVTGSGCFVNDVRRIVTVGRNAKTGVTSALLLVPDGTLPVPAAPANLRATPHVPTSAEPFLSIDLAWESASVLTRTYDLERRQGGEWVPLELIPPGQAPSHRDTTVQPGQTYDYRVRAVGVSGPGPWSGVVTATAVQTGLDTEPPVVTLSQPAAGATVSGLVEVSAGATDNQGVARLQLAVLGPLDSVPVLLGSVERQGSLVVNWDTRALKAGSYRLYATAEDAAGNTGEVQRVVTVAKAPGELRVTGITFAKETGGRRPKVIASVAVRDASGAPVSGVTLKVRWTLPGGSVQSQSGRTDRQGVARFSAAAVAGTYGLTVTSATKSGFALNTAESVLFGSFAN